MSPEENQKPDDDDDELDLVPLEEEEPPALDEPAGAEEETDEPAASEENEPLELEVLPDDEPSAPIVVPEAADESQADEVPAVAAEESEDSRQDPDEEEEPEPPPDPPTLIPFQGTRIFAWPFTGTVGSSVVGMLFVATFFLGFGWVLGAIGLGVGTTLRITGGALVGYFLFAYARHIVLASIEGCAGPPSVSVASDEASALHDGFRGLALAGLYALPAAALLVVTRPEPHPILEVHRSVFSVFFGLVLALGGWALFPASFLLSAVSGQLGRSGPRRAFALAKAGGARYLLVLVPCGAVIAARIIFPDRHFGSVLLEAVGILLFLHTAYMLGLLARETEEVTELLLEAEDGDEEPGEEQA